MPGASMSAALAKFALLAAIAASPASAAPKSKFEPLVKSWQVKPPRCAVTAYFASIGMGTDHAVRGRVDALLERDPTVVSVRPYLRGREGETLLCIRVTREAAIGPLFRRLRALVPPGPRGFPITIEATGGRRFSRY